MKKRLRDALSIRVSDELRSEIEKVARQEDVGMAEAVRRLVNLGLMTKILDA